MTLKRNDIWLSLRTTINAKCNNGETQQLDRKCNNGARHNNASVTVISEARDTDWGDAAATTCDDALEHSSRPDLTAPRQPLDQLFALITVLIGMSGPAPPGCNNEMCRPLPLPPPDTGGKGGSIRLRESGLNAEPRVYHVTQTVTPECDDVRRRMRQ